jgi:hypothetical protein
MNARRTDPNLELSFYIYDNKVFSVQGEKYCPFVRKIYRIVIYI